MLRVACSETDRRTRKTKLRLIAEQATGLAMNGDMRALEFVADRLEGKAVQRLQDQTPIDPEKERQQAIVRQQMIDMLDGYAQQKAHKPPGLIIDPPQAPKPGPAPSRK